MNKTVFLLGAGFSYDAGIPLMNNFMEKMIKVADTKCKPNGQSLNQADVALFDQIQKIRHGIDGYHGRSLFDDRNIEALLSILSFESIEKRKSGKKLQLFTEAISRTIEIFTDVKQVNYSLGNSRTIHGEYSEADTGNRLYNNFWKSIMRHPTFANSGVSIITLNYDLTLERSLVRSFFEEIDYNRPPQFNAVEIDYCIGGNNKIQLYTGYRDVVDVASMTNRRRGTLINRNDCAIDPAKTFKVELLKLHGSINFPINIDEEAIAADKFTIALKKPYITPPIFNKIVNKRYLGPWSKAVETLRSARNIVVCGYSLPLTDSYMQFFLKYSLGPNFGLNQIIVFDPVLHRNGIEGQEIRNRYSECFSPQLRGRIVFDQAMPAQDCLKGSAEHMIDILLLDPDRIVYD